MMSITAIRESTRNIPSPMMNEAASAPATDQRGFQRVVGGKIDIGAWENQSQLFTLTPRSARRRANSRVNKMLQSFDVPYTVNAR